MQFTIKQKLPSLNEYINACRRNKFAGAKFKQDIETIISLYIRQALRKGTLTRASKYPLIVKITWFEKTKKRDVDNIQSAQKYILDALQKSGIIPNDSRKYIKQIYHEIKESDADYVIVDIEEAGDDS